MCMLETKVAEVAETELDQQELTRAAQKSPRLVQEVDTVEVFDFPLPFPTGFSQLVIATAGKVATSGWTNVRLSPRFYVMPPKDGIWDFDLIGDPPAGIVLNVVLPV